MGRGGLAHPQICSLLTSRRPQNRLPHLWPRLPKVGTTDLAQLDDSLMPPSF